jgi:translation initiation factor IF-2
MTGVRAVVLALMAVLLIIGVAACGVKEADEGGGVAQTGRDEAVTRPDPGEAVAEVGEGKAEAQGDSKEAVAEGKKGDDGKPVTPAAKAAKATPPQVAQQRGGGEGGARPEGGRGEEGRGEGARGPGGPEAINERLKAAGASAVDLQAIEAHRTKQREIIGSLREAMGSLREAAGEDGTDAQAKKAVSQYEGLMKTALSNLAKAEANLKTQLKLSGKPRLHGALLSMGVLDNGTRGGGGRGGRPGGPGGRGEGGGGPRSGERPDGRGGPGGPGRSA